MTKVEELAKRVEVLSREELGDFRQWFLEFDGALWDRQLEQDARNGKLDNLAEEALREYRAGKTKPLDESFG